MTPTSHHRRQGLPRTEEEAQARAAAAEAEAAVSQSSEPKPDATAASQHSAAGATPRRRRGLPRTEAEAAARATEPQPAPAQPPSSAAPSFSAAPSSSTAPAGAVSSEAAEDAPAPGTSTAHTPHRPGRRRGLPRTEEEAAARAAEAQKPGPAPAAAPTPAPAPASTPAPETIDEPAPAPAAARRTGLDSTPSPAPASTAADPQPAPKATTAAPSGLPKTPAPTPAEAKAGAGEGVAPIPQAKREPARVFAGRSLRQWTLLAAAGLGGVVVLAVILVLGAQWVLGTSTGADFLESYPGQYAQPDAPGGYPWWLNWAHFFNVFLMVLVIKTGIQIRTETRPQAYWTPKWNKKRKISLTIWLHQSLDLLWVLNGVIFVILLFTTGYWERVVPTSWEVFPNAVSAGLQYASLDWPTHGEWAHYNSLQELAYFTTIFLAAPLAILTGVRMSGLWPANNRALNKAFPVEAARAVHFPVMIYFLVFITTHVILVLATGALRNLNLIYTGQDATNWTGFWLFTLTLALITAAALATRALVIAPIASLFGRVGR